MVRLVIINPEGLVQLAVVTLCFMTGLFMLIFAGGLVAFEWSTHQHRYPSEDQEDLPLIFQSILHGLHILFVSSISILCGLGLWFLGARIAVDVL